MDEEVITRQALGRIAVLGEFYDAHRDAFCGHSVFTESIDKYIKITDTEKTHIEHNFENSLNAKLSKFNVEAELKGSFLAGLIKIEAGGHGQYLTSSASNAKEASASLICRMLTKHESVNISNRSLISDLSLDAIKNIPNATHIVTAIQWGAGAIAELIYKHQSDESQQEIKGSLKAAFQKFTLAVEANGDIEYTRESLKNYENFYLKFYVDALPNGENVPQNVEDAKEFMKKIPKLIEKANGGKGVPQVYTMIPINSLKLFFKQTECFDRIIHKVDENVIEETVQLFDEIAENLKIINTIYAEFSEFSYCLKEETLSDIYNKMKSIKFVQNALRNDLYHVLIEVRYGRKNISVLTETLQKYQEDSTIHQIMLYSNSNPMRSFKEKVMFAKCLKNKRICYIGRETSLESERIKNNLKEFYAFFCDWPNIENRTENLNLFLELSSEKAVLLVDAEINPLEQKLVPNGNRICHYLNGRFIDTDYLQTWKKEYSKCYAKCQIKKRIFDENLTNLTEVSFRCPLSYKRNQCDKTEHQWHCYDCDEIMQYDNDKNFYCQCGSGPIEEFEYRCVHEKHGESFIKFDESQMKIFLKKNHSTKNTPIDLIPNQKLPNNLQQINRDYIELITELKNDLVELNAEKAELQKKLYVLKPGIEVQNLAYPRNICTAPKCVELKQYTSMHICQTVFKTVCHEKCHCVPDTIHSGMPNIGMKKCIVMNSEENCKKCGCSWSYHMLINYEQRESKEMVEDKNVKKMLSENQLAIEKLEKRIYGTYDNMFNIQET